MHRVISYKVLTKNSESMWQKVFVLAVCALYSVAGELGCRPFWEENNGKCYRFPTTSDFKHDQSSCSNFCSVLGASILCVESSDENDFIASRSSAVNSASDLQLWLGINDATQEGSFEWPASCPSTFTNFNTGEPNNAGNEDYVMLYVTADGKWNDINGETSSVYCACEEPVFELLPAESDLVCRSGWEKFGDKCYYIPSSADPLVTSPDCTAFCSGLDASMLCVEDMSENYFLMDAGVTMTPALDFKYWLGYSDTAQEGNFEWSGSCPSTFEYFSGGEPNNFNNEDYTTLERARGGQWNDRSSSLLASCACEEPAFTEPTAVPTASPTVAPTRASAVIESSHRYLPNTNEGWSVSFPGVTCYTLSMDPQSWTPNRHDFVKIFAVNGATKTRYPVRQSKLFKFRLRNFGPVNINADSIEVNFVSDERKESWGFRLIVEECTAIDN